MKNKIIRLMKEGFKLNTLSKLTEGQISTLYKKIVSEQPKPVERSKVVKTTELPVGAQTTIGNMSISNVAGKTQITQTQEGELEEISDEDALGADALQAYTGQQGPHGANQMAPDGLDDDSDDNREMMGMTEAKKRKKKSNPWAICTSQLGKEFKTRERHLWSPKQKNKYERCVKDVKKSLKEGKNPVSLFLENQIIRIVEKHIPPRITKQDLLKYLVEDTTTAPKTKPKGPKTSPTEKPKERPSHPGKNPNPGEKTTPKAKRETKEDTTTAPSKPITKPTTKPSERPKPSHPGKNPNPGEKTTPKAISPERAKDEVIKTIMNILEK